MMLERHISMYNKVTKVTLHLTRYLPSPNERHHAIFGSLPVLISDSLLHQDLVIKALVLNSSTTSCLSFLSSMEYRIYNSLLASQTGGSIFYCSAIHVIPFTASPLSILRIDLHPCLYQPACQPTH